MTTACNIQTEDGVINLRDMHKSDVGEGFPPPPGKRVTLHNWTSTTAHWRHAHLNPTIFHSTQVYEGDSPAWVLPRKMIDPDRLLRATVLWGDTRKNARRMSVREWLERSETDALVAAYDGHIVAEIHCGNMTSHARHMTWCGSKAFLTTLMAPYLAGKKQALDREVVVQEYDERLGSSAFNKATLGQVLDQTTGVDSTEFLQPDAFDKLDASAKKAWDFGSAEFCRATHGYARNSRACGLFPKLAGEPVGGFHDFLFSLQKNNRSHGESFGYRDCNAMAAQVVLETVTGMPYQSHVKNLARELGFERSPHVLLDPINMPVGAYGLYLAPRDWLRWGIMLSNRGKVGTGETLPGMRELVDHIMSDPGHERLAGLWETTHPNVGYSSQFWTAATKAGRDPVIQAAGGWLQKCFVDPTRKLVLVQVGSYWDQAPDKKHDKETWLHTELPVWSFLDEVLPDLAM